MSATASSMASLDVARRFADAYARGDAAQAAHLLAPDVREREITPGGIVDQRGPDAVIDEATEFLRPYGRPEVLEHVVEPLGDLVRWSTRWRLDAGDGSWLVEWHAFLAVRDGLIERMDITCSGRVPAPSRGATPADGPGRTRARPR